MRKELLIFGADGALGQGITEVFLNKDYDKIYLFAPHEVEKDLPSKAVFISCGDLSSEENVLNAFSAVKPDKNKNLFLYSTVGGYFGGKTIWDTSTDEWDRMFNINLKTSFLVSKHFALLVKQCHAGSIIFTTALAALGAEEGKSAYISSKRGLAALVETLAEEGKMINLTSNAIAPYIIDTPANREWGKETDIKTWIKPAEIGELAHSIFSSFHFISGNIFRLKIRLDI